MLRTNARVSFRQSTIPQVIIRRRRIRSEVSFDRPGKTEEDLPDFEFKDAGPTPPSTSAFTVSGTLILFDRSGSFSLGFVR